jgi:hypothetical protein
MKGAMASAKENHKDFFTSPLWDFCNLKPGAHGPPARGRLAEDAEGG